MNLSLLPLRCKGSRRHSLAPFPSVILSRATKISHALHRQLRLLLALFSMIFMVSGKLKAQSGAALNFDGADDNVQVSSLAFGNHWTAECWANPTNVNAGWHSIMGQNYWNGPAGWIVAI